MAQRHVGSLRIGDDGWQFLNLKNYIGETLVTTDEFLYCWEPMIRAGLVSVLGVPVLNRLIREFHECLV